jgi:hypothetical protein
MLEEAKLGACQLLCMDGEDNEIKAKRPSSTSLPAPVPKHVIDIQGSWMRQGDSSWYNDDSSRRSSRRCVKEQSVRETSPVIAATESNTMPKSTLMDSLKYLSCIL